jgi:hypothetical protein
LWPKKDYVIELRHLQTVVKLGFVVTEISKALSYDQKKWLAPFVETVVRMRQGAGSPEEDKMLKLVMNSLAGRLQMNVRKHDDTRAVKRVCVDDFSSPRFRALHTVYGDPNEKEVDALHLLTMSKTSIELSAPIFVGVCVLELAKEHNLRLWYDGIRSCWADARLIVHDTDSFFVSVEEEGGDEVGKKLKALSCVDGAKTKKPGLLKIEAERILEVVALGKKMYSALLPDDERKVASVGLKVPPSHQAFRDRLAGGHVSVEVDVCRSEGMDRRVQVERRLLGGTPDTSRYWIGAVSSKALGSR